MGTIKNAIKNGVSSSIGRMTSGIKIDDITSKLNQAKSRLDIPEFQVPDSIKNLKPDIDFSQLKVPDAGKYMDPVKNKMTRMFSGVSLPSEIGGFQLPELPNLSSLTDMANNHLAGTGMSLKKGIDFNDIKYAVTKQDIMSLIDFNIDMPIDMSSINHVSDGTITSLDSFDMTETQREIDAMTAEMNMESIDISQYF